MTKDADSGWRMAAKTPNPAKSRAEPSLTRKQVRKFQEKSCTSSSSPWNKPTLSGLQDIEDSSHSCPVRSGAASKPDLKPMQTLTECLQLLRTLAEEINNINQCGSKKAAPQGSTKEPGSLESSRTLILQWAQELELNMVKKGTKPTDEKKKQRDDPEKKEKTELQKHNDKLQQWAVELSKIKEANGVSDEELKKLLYPRGQKESRMAAILPMLEFVAWSLLSEDTEEAVSMRWLPTKQKAWRTGTGSPRYIPNSVWQWIQSASVSVRLDVSTSHSWLAVSSDRLQVQEAAMRSADLSNSSQRFAEWPCVLGDATITAGRHYWEVEVSPNGSWRVGVMSECAPRKQKPTMSPRTGFWVLWKGSSLWACTDEPTKLQKAAVPRLIGVYVDVREGQVSFYDVDRRVHIYTFSDTFRHSLVPVFGCMSGHSVLKIIPAQTSDRKM
ncbi:E3 ubiquitin-protein ligase TRIM39-like [Centropristis striata]|uniref:E3 ubiquitin-protein ligase TRIM39-like n=1 Tax=Centropristis striata TaxID=184440 RepID=UPI0027E0A513|nr:E3 ubiquitin-protein ligase TRIM39-like [Centropristis striata]